METPSLHRAGLSGIPTPPTIDPAASDAEPTATPAAVLWSEREAAAAMGLTPRTLYSLRHTAGLPFVMVRRRVLYRPAALAAWAAARERVNGGQHS